MTNATLQVISAIKIEDKAWGEENMPAEIVWAPGKSTKQLVIALQRVLQTGVAVLAVRVSPKVSFIVSHTTCVCHAI